MELLTTDNLSCLLTVTGVLEVPAAYLLRYDIGQATGDLTSSVVADMLCLAFPIHLNCSSLTTLGKLKTDDSGGITASVKLESLIMQLYCL